MARQKATAIGGEIDNGASEALAKPYTAEISVKGVAPLLFHRWSGESVKAKNDAGKNSKAKKTDDTGSYLYRGDSGELCIPTENFRRCLIDAARYKQDPRSPRKSARDLFNAGLISLIENAPLGANEPDYYDSRRVLIQRNAITRVRPALNAGWRATFEIMVQTPEYITPDDLHEVANNAGRLVGLCDFRPSFGRFLVERFRVLD